MRGEQSPHQLGGQMEKQTSEFDPAEVTSVTPYAFNSTEFTYSMRCSLCRNERPHTLDQHDRLRGAK